MAGGLIVKEAQAAVRRGTLPPGSACPNCAATLQGAFCHACGQKADTFHRPVWNLVVEGFSDLTDFDGRFIRTIPRLIGRPGALTREYLDGKRVGQIPPFRLFLTAVVLVFVVGGLHIDTRPRITARTDVVEATVNGMNTAADARRQTARIKRAEPDKPNVEVYGANAGKQVELIKSWAHGFTLLGPVVLVPLLALVFVRRRGVFAFDHMVFSLHSLSFQGLWFSVMLLVRGVHIPHNGWGFLVIAVHMLFHLRGTYGLSWFGAGWRTVLLLVGELAGIFVLLVGLLLVTYLAAK